MKNNFNQKHNTRVRQFFLIIVILICFYPLSYSQVINSATKVFIDQKSKKKTERTLTIQINNKNSNWLSKVSIRHNPKQKFTLEYANITSKDGQIVRKLKKKDILTLNDLSYQAFYQDDLISKFELFWDEYPYQIEYSYTIVEDEYVNVAWWSPVEYTNVATLQSSLEIHAPANFKLQIDATGKVDSEVSLVEGTKIYSWKGSKEEKIKKQIYSPALKEIIPSVKVIPSKFNYGTEGSSDSWAAFGNWINELNKGTHTLPGEEKMEIEKLIEGMVDKKEIIKTIYYHLQDHTKYVNVSIDVGGLKSFPASYVSLNKYGDCKALTTYMKGMLSSLDIASKYTIVNGGSNTAKVNPDYPSQQFNHVILSIPLDGDTIWLENTSNSLPFNYIGTFTQNKYALAVDGLKSKLVATPKLSLEEVLQERSYEFHYANGETWTSNINLILRGDQFESMRHLMTNENETIQKDKFLKWIDIKDFELEEWKFLNHNRDNLNLEMEIKGDCKHPSRKIGKMEFINPLRIKLPKFEKTSERVFDVRLNYPIHKLDKCTYLVEEIANKNVKIPEPINLESEYGKYSTKFTYKENAITVEEYLVLYENTIPLDRYDKFYAFISKIKEYKKQSVIIIE